MAQNVYLLQNINDMIQSGDIEIYFNENKYEIYCTADVLESFRKDILNTVDLDFQNVVKVVQTVKHSTDTPIKNVSYVLTITGG